jgi:hypothetical protein
MIIRLTKLGYRAIKYIKASIKSLPIEFKLNCIRHLLISNIQMNIGIDSDLVDLYSSI